MGDNGYIMRRDGNLVEASFAAHRRPAVDVAAGNHVVQLGLIDPSRHRARILDRKLIIATLPGKVWHEVTGLTARYACHQVNLAAYGIDIAGLQRSMERIFAQVGIPKQLVLVTPVSRTVAEVQLPSVVFDQKLDAMRDLVRNTQRASGHGIG